MDSVDCDAVEGALVGAASRAHGWNSSWKLPVTRDDDRGVSIWALVFFFVIGDVSRKKGRVVWRWSCARRAMATTRLVADANGEWAGLVKLE